MSATSGAGVADELRFALRAARTAISHPVEAVDRVQIWRESSHVEEPVDLPDVQTRVDEALHAFIGEPGCDTCAGELARVSEAMMRRLQATTYHDASTALAQAVWITTRHRRPLRAVETGVGQGVTTNCILSAMDANDYGHLTSIDLPPLSARWHGSVAGAVEPRVKTRWTYERGSVRRTLPRVLTRDAPIGLYVHDALHTYSSMQFEFSRAWDRLEEGGVLIADDIALNRAFLDFAAGKAHVLVAEPAKHGAVGVLRKVAPGG